MRLIDISGPIYSGMWQYFPEYPGAQIDDLPQPAALRDREPVYLQRFVLSGQSGTYIQTRAHVDRSAEAVADLPPERFWLPAVIVDVAPKQRLEPVQAADLERRSPEIRPGDAVLLRSGWDRNWRDPDFIEGSPFISPDAARWLFAHDIALLGSDFPRFDRVHNPCFPWAELWEAVPLILAPVCNLPAASPRRFTLAAFPLKIEGACASPCRAVLFDTTIAGDT